MKAKDFGKYGGRVIRGFSGGGKKWVPGAIIRPEDVKEWPLANKTALHSSGKVEWFPNPDDVSVKDEAEESSVSSDEGKQADVETESEDVEESSDSSEQSEETEESEEPAKAKSSRRRRSPASKTKKK